MPKIEESFYGVRFQQGLPLETSEFLTPEKALQIRINGQPYTITMRTPGQDGPLSLGLLLTEGLLQNRDQIIAWKSSGIAKDGIPFSIDIELPLELLKGKNLVNRSLVSNASCGVCGKTDLEDVFQPIAPLNHDRILDIRLIESTLKTLVAHQATFASTGGCHGAALFRIDGSLLTVHEDIGRHNAVDKVIGDLLMQGKLPEAEILVVSGRVSFEIAMKCLRARIPFLCAVSAPSSLAVDYCIEKGITLAAFCRGDRATVYSHVEHIQQFSDRMEAVAQHE
jgi:FdhD protein